MPKKLKIKALMIMFLAAVLAIGALLSVSVVMDWFSPSVEYQTVVKESYDVLAGYFTKAGIVYVDKDLEAVSMYECMVKYFPDIVRVAREQNENVANSLQAQLDVMRASYNTSKYAAIGTAVGMAILFILMLNEIKGFMRGLKESKENKKVPVADVAK